MYYKKYIYIFFVGLFYASTNWGAGGRHRICECGAATAVENFGRVSLGRRSPRVPCSRWIVIWNPLSLFFIPCRRYDDILAYAFLSSHWSLLKLRDHILVVFLSMIRKNTDSVHPIRRDCVFFGTQLCFLGISRDIPYMQLNAFGGWRMTNLTCQQSTSRILDWIWIFESVYFNAMYIREMYTVTPGITEDFSFGIYWISRRSKLNQWSMRIHRSNRPRTSLTPRTDRIQSSIECSFTKNFVLMQFTVQECLNSNRYTQRNSYFEFLKSAGI